MKPHLIGIIKEPKSEFGSESSGFWNFLGLLALGAVGYFFYKKEFAVPKLPSFSRLYPPKDTSLLDSKYQTYLKSLPKEPEERNFKSAKELDWYRGGKWNSIGQGRWDKSASDEHGSTILELQIEKEGNQYKWSSYPEYGGDRRLPSNLRDEISGTANSFQAAKIAAERAIGL
jgi:hypothetical protein